MERRLKGRLGYWMSPSKEAVFICILRVNTSEKCCRQVDKELSPFLTDFPGESWTSGNNNGMQRERFIFVSKQCGLTADIPRRCPHSR